MFDLFKLFIEEFCFKMLIIIFLFNIFLMNEDFIRMVRSNKCRLVDQKKRLV